MRMRICKTVGIALAAAMVFLLGAPVQAGTVIFDPNNATKAIGIANLDIAGTLFNVEFTPDLTAGLVYGDFPSSFDFITSETALAVTIAVDEALNAEGGVFSVGGELNPVGRLSYLVGFDSESENNIERVIAWEASTMISDDVWSTGVLPEAVSYLEPRVWATFTVVPEPGTAFLMGLGLAGLGVVGRSRREES